MALKPERLRPGDTIGIVAPAGAFKKERLQPGLAYLERAGYGVRVGAHVYDRKRYMAGEDGARAEDLHAFFEAPEVRAIFAARGGYGTTRLLDLLDYDLIQRNPKIFLGFSDTTALQLALYRHAGLITTSGITVCADLGPEREAFTEAAMWRAVRDGAVGPFEGLRPLAGGAAEGRLLGGCLSLVSALQGTAHLPAFDGAVLLLEDVDEAPYRIDRMLTHLRQTGLLGRVAGVAFGHFEGAKPDEGADWTMEEVLADRTADLGVPVVCGLPYGHQRRRAVLPLGARVRLDADAGRLELLESTVA
ncbi:MAG: LD-carboxypeptidase [Candidatus Latescibacteria bacterium]|nr:LD-carboxypeptidase [Candidatus Latescibacterota bacterium]